jgi:hypothetical protein
MQDPPKRAPMAAMALVLGVSAGGLALAEWLRERADSTAEAEPLALASVDQVKAAIAAREWGRARVLLDNQRRFGAMAPGFEGLLTQVAEGERRQAVLKKAVQAIRASARVCRMVISLDNYDAVVANALAGCETIERPDAGPESMDPPEPPIFEAELEAQAVQQLNEARRLLAQGASSLELTPPLERCVELAPNVATVVLSNTLATCHKLLGATMVNQRERARGHFERYLELATQGDPDVVLVKSALEGLQDP